MYKETIGIVGGFGAYATMNFYGKILDEFASNCERNYPHIIMDNNFTMPSRTRALLYNEAYDEIVHEIAKSIKLLMENKADKIIMVCGTAHFFLGDVYKLLPEAKEHVINVIDVLGDELKKRSINKVLVVAAEGALQKNLYLGRLEMYGIEVVQPPESDYDEIRYFIECVKQNKLDYNISDKFKIFIDKYAIENVVLGCTEFPILLDFINKHDVGRLIKYYFYDPMEIVIQYLKRTLV